MYKNNANVLTGLIILFSPKTKHYNSYSMKSLQTEILHGMQIVFLVSMATFTLG